MRIGKTDVSELTEFSILIYFSVLALLPSMSNIPFYLPLLIGVSYLLIVVFGRAYPGDKNTVLVFIFTIVFVSLLYTFLTPASTIAESASNRMLKRFLSKVHQYFMMFFPIFALTRVMRMKRSRKIIIVVLSIVLLLFVMRTTMLELAINARATRAWGGQVSNANAAGYYFVYSVPFFLLSLVYYSLKGKNKWLRALTLIVAVLCFIFLLNAQYTLAVIITILCVLILINMVLRRPLVIFLSIVITVGVAAALPSALSFIASKVSSRDISIRLLELAAYFKTGELGYNLGGRFKLYYEAVKAFFRSPVWGNRNFNVDGHSTFLMILADLGLLGAVPFFKLIKRTKNICFDMLPDSKLFYPLFIAFILMGLTNPVHSSSSLSWSLWFISPLIYSLVQEEQTEDE